MLYMQYTSEWGMATPALEDEVETTFIKRSGMPGKIDGYKSRPAHPMSSFAVP